MKKNKTVTNVGKTITNAGSDYTILQQENDKTLLVRNNSTFPCYVVAQNFCEITSTWDCANYYNGNIIMALSELYKNKNKTFKEQEELASAFNIKIPNIAIYQEMVYLLENITEKFEYEISESECEISRDIVSEESVVEELCYLTEQAYYDVDNNISIYDLCYATIKVFIKEQTNIGNITIRKIKYNI